MIDLGLKFIAHRVLLTLHRVKIIAHIVEFVAHIGLFIRLRGEIAVESVDLTLIICAQSFKFGLSIIA